ncbi:MAG: DUF1501 domain-containing protein [Mycobacterium sp.]
MPKMNRRNFLIASAGAVAVVGGAAVTVPMLLDHATEHPLAANRGILVIVTLYGGNDGINTVIPYNDNAYHDARPDLAFAPGEVLDLDGHLGLNPALAGLNEVWRDKELAIVRGVGYPKQDRSHFRSMDIWQTASPDRPVPTGWIGRWLDATGDDPLRALNIGAVLSPMAVGEKHLAAALSANLPLVPNEVAATLTALSQSDPHDTPAMASVRATYRTNKTTDHTLSQFAATAPPPDAQADPGKQLADDLELVAQCIRARVPSRVYMVDLGGFDTHADERGDHQRLLQSLDNALTPFLRQMRTNPYGRDVVVMVYSEFGRRVHANASQGTDHGSSAPVFIAGTPVKGGFYGDEPSLTDLVDGDLKTTTDFRDVYYELLTKTIGTDPEPVVGTGRRNIGFL